MGIIFSAPLENSSFTFDMENDGRVFAGNADQFGKGLRRGDQLFEVTEVVKKQAEEYYRQLLQEKADSFQRRLDAGDPDATVQIEMAGQREAFEDESWRRFFLRHISVMDCDATRSMLSEFFRGDIITLGGLEQALEQMRDRLPKRTI